MRQVSGTLPAVVLALALGAAFSALPAAAQSSDNEKCYGVALKGSCEKAASKTSPTGFGRLEAFKEKKA